MTHLTCSGAVTHLISSSSWTVTNLFFQPGYGLGSWTVTNLFLDYSVV